MSGRRTRGGKHRRSPLYGTLGSGSLGHPPHGSSGGPKCWTSPSPLQELRFRVSGLAFRVRRPWRRVGWENLPLSLLTPPKTRGGGGWGGYPASFSVEEQATHTAQTHGLPCPPPLPPPYPPPLPVGGLNRVYLEAESRVLVW